MLNRWVCFLSLLSLAGCAPAPSTDAGSDAALSDAATAAKPTCDLIAERCHPYDGTDPTATMCHRAVESPSATEASCMALRDGCFAACPEEGDGGHSHGADGSADR